MSEEDVFRAEERKAVRHSLRTFLNHVAGYSDILKQEAADEGQAELCALYEEISAAALKLRERALPFFLDETGNTGPSPRGEAEGREVYGILYDIIAHVQSAKRVAQNKGASRYLPDTEKILEAANGIVDLFEERLSNGTAFVEPEPAGIAEPRLLAEEATEARRSGRILVVDDDAFNRELLARHLERQGHIVCQAQGGEEALEVLSRAPFDLLIIDLMMPGMNGYQLLERVKGDALLKDLYVIVISALEDTRSVARCIQLGAEDYLPREFEPVVLKARIESCLEKKLLKDKEELYVAAVLETERRLRAELKEGAAYVRGLLPPKLDGPALHTDWVYIPSLSLGGDVFGYHDIEDGRLALYLIDVSGHGIEAALFSVTLMNLLKTQALPGADFGDPASVLARLNESFRMEEQNNLYFTAWYGVYDPVTRRLSYASAGSPPAVLVLPGGGVEQLATGGTIVGAEEFAVYCTRAAELPQGARLYLFSDGVFEVRNSEGGMFGIEAFIGLLAGLAARERGPLLGPLIKAMRTIAKGRRFDDDVSMVEFRFD